jgi:hypothetical protein
LRPDREELLREFPAGVAEIVQEGEWFQLREQLAPEFRAHGMGRDEVVFALRHQQQFGQLFPVVAWVVSDPAEEGLDERGLVILGMLIEGDPDQPRLGACRAFRVEARLRFSGGRWSALSARYEIR